jgi:hypothetical protein
MMSLIDKAKEISGQAADKAKELTGQAAEMAGDLGGDDLIASTIIRVAIKKDRVNAILEKESCNYRIIGIEVDNGIPPKATFSVEKVSE